MTNEPLKDPREPTHRKWLLRNEARRLREERRAHRADRTIRVIGGGILLAIVVAVVLASLHFLMKLLTHVF